MSSLDTPHSTQQQYRSICMICNYVLSICECQVMKAKSTLTFIESHCHMKCWRYVFYRTNSKVYVYTFSGTDEDYYL